VQRRFLSDLEAALHPAVLMNWAYPGPKPTATRALAWLKVHQSGEPNAPVLLWGDARIDNMIFAPGGTPVAVLDWETATFGQAE
jgi:aminoglycoside phosphotransferase (APT) family kinase protein